MKPASEKAMKMLHLWKCCSDEERFTYAVLAAALEKWGLKICAEQYCYTSTGNHMHEHTLSYLCMS